MIGIHLICREGEMMMRNLKDLLRESQGKTSRKRGFRKDLGSMSMAQFLKGKNFLIFSKSEFSLRKSLLGEFEVNKL